MDGVTTISFNRVRDTGDSNDLTLDECRFFLFAFGGEVDIASPQTAAYHGFGPLRRAPSPERICIPSFADCSSGKVRSCLVVYDKLALLFYRTYVLYM